jgi:TonB family protein
MMKRRLLVIMLIATSAAAAPIRPSVQQIMSWLVATPHPQYPPDARARGATGSGMFKIHFIRKTGTVRYVQILQSTGDKALDAAAVTAFKHWRFKPGVLPSVRSMALKPTKEPFADEDFVVKVPVTFTLGTKPRVGGPFASPR